MRKQTPLDEVRIAHGLLQWHKDCRAAVSGRKDRPPFVADVLAAISMATALRVAVGSRISLINCSGSAIASVNSP